MTAKHVPTISPFTKGPLGLMHLPRLWQKCLLGFTGKLADGYKFVGPGFDFTLLDAIGIAHDDVRVFFTENRPTYAQFEAWVRAYPGVKLDAETIEAVNARLVGYAMKPERRQEIAAQHGVSPELPALMLVDLDTWADFHQSVA